MREQRQNKPRKHLLNDELSSVFSSLGFSRLTEIQKKASPVIFQKIDSLVIAPTGSGKTECSVIPIFRRLKASRRPGKTTALYITPLRALNRDVFRRITKYAESEGLSIQIRHGDTTQAMRRKIALNPPDVLITTPETLVILLTNRKALDALSELQWVVIDEVHELLGSERGAQLSLSMERLQVNSTREMTRVGLSATVGDPVEASKFVSGTKRKCRIIQDTSVRRYDVDVQYIHGTISDVADSIVRYVADQKIDSPVLLFANTRGEAEFLASVMRDKSARPIDLHHGSLSLQVRQETEESLRSGASRIVVCTSSLELGLDIGSVDIVVHYGSPRQVSRLMQRIGRSRHSRGSSAKGLIITNNPDDEFETRAILERIREGSIEKQDIHTGSLDVLAHHLVGLSMQLGKISVRQSYDILTRAYPFRELGLEDLVSVLDLLDSNYLVHFDRKEMTFVKKLGSFRYYFENLSTIPDILKFRVFDSVGKRIIGTLDQRFVGSFGQQGNVFVLRGSQWRIMNVDEKALIVNVEPFRTGSINVPYWEGENIPVDYRTARKVAGFRTKVRSGQLKMINQEISRLDFVSGQHNIAVESVRREGIVVLHACFGTRINSSLATLLSSMLSSQLGVVVESRADAYRIALSSTARITKEMIDRVLLDTYDLHDIMTAALAGTHNVNWKTWSVAKKFGIVGRGAIYDQRQARFLYERYSDTPLAKEALRELFHDKYDIDGADMILEKIRDGTIVIEWHDADKFSRLAEPILDHTTKYYASPASIDQGILDLVKERISKTKHRLVCARCGIWERTYETHEVPELLACPHCRARQIAATFYSDHELSGIIRKKHAGKKLSGEQQHRFERAWKAASLVENFGRTALVVLSGFGIGVDTAARVLRNMIDSETLYRQIYEAERQYVMTRGFWD